MPITIQVKGDTTDVNDKLAQVGEQVDGVTKKANQARDALGRFSREGSSSGERVKESFGGLQKQLDGVSKSLFDVGGMMKSAFAGGIAALGIETSIGGIISSLQSWRQTTLELADAQIQLDNRLRMVADNEYHRQVLHEQLLKVANESRSDLNSTGETYVRLRKATDDLRLSEQQVLGITQTLAQSMQMSGASATESASAMLQLTQAFASGRLQGDEFRSLAENAPDLMKAFSRELGVSRSELKQLGSEGKITAEVMAGALEKMSDDVALKFAATTKTSVQRLQAFQNDIANDPSKFQHEMNATDYNSVGRVGEFAENWAQRAGLIATDEEVATMDAANQQFFQQLQLVKQVHDELSSRQNQDPWVKTTMGTPDEIKDVTDAINRMVAVSHELSDPNRPLQAAASWAQLQGVMFSMGTQGPQLFDKLAETVSKYLGIVEGHGAKNFFTGPGKKEHEVHRSDTWDQAGDAPIVPAAISNLLGLKGGPTGIEDYLDEKLRGAYGPTLHSISEFIGKIREELAANQPQENIWEGVVGSKSALEDLLEPWKEMAKYIEKATEATKKWNEEMRGGAKNEAYKQFQADHGYGGAQDGISAAYHKFTDDAMNTAKVVEDVFTTAFKGAEDALVKFVETGHLSLSSLAHDLEDLLLRMLFRQAVGMIGGGGGGLPAGAVAGGGPGIIPLPGYGGSSSARAAPQQTHLIIGEDASRAIVANAQDAIVNVTYKQHGNFLSTRERLRSRD